jgi:hypothetical protein
VEGVGCGVRGRGIGTACCEVRCNLDWEAGGGRCGTEGRKHLQQVRLCVWRGGGRGSRHLQRCAAGEGSILWRQWAAAPQSVSNRAPVWGCGVRGRGIGTACCLGCNLDWEAGGGRCDTAGREPATAGTHSLVRGIKPCSLGYSALLVWEWCVASHQPRGGITSVGNSRAPVWGWVEGGGGR